ncbi:hypothetical protein O181_065094 [Austropuccinia psidii MF-1]|uniref:Uncharacterized protein n=1 Tax=Austropuccinia psidii MF-1 TaxID=1389203 RepID=A0A9Q3EQT5_9BASI|nr:hypothetical protein [Austropuccinia psidii MF-1]
MILLPSDFLPAKPIKQGRCYLLVGHRRRAESVESSDRATAHPKNAPNDYLLLPTFPSWVTGAWLRASSSQQWMSKPMRKRQPSRFLELPPRPTPRDISAGAGGAKNKTSCSHCLRGVGHAMTMPVCLCCFIPLNNATFI